MPDGAAHRNAGAAAADGRGTTRRHLLREVLALAAAPTFVRHARASDVPRFALGIASGSPRHDRLVLWTRLVGAGLPPEVEVQWELAHDAAFTRIAARGRERATVDEAHSVHAEPAGLDAGRWYFYRFTALGQRSATGRTRTTPIAGAAEPLDFAIASCQRWDHGHYAAWRHLAAESLDLVLFLGDYIYEYGYLPMRVRSHDGIGRLRTLDDYRARYALYKGDAALQAAHAAAPWITIWDDHEVENDYAGLQGEAADGEFAAQRAAAYRAWWEHMPVPQALRRVAHTLRLHERYDWGTLARIHTLDDRQYRDAQACRRWSRPGSATVTPFECHALEDPQRSLLGAAQERWLADGWSTAHAWNLLAQQTLMARLSWRDPAGPERGQYWTDGWDGYAPARQRLLNTVAERRVPGVVVLGGDVHANVVADLKVDFDDAAAPVVASEFCGTSITSQGMAQARLDAARRFNPHLRYARSDQRGYMRFALDARQLEARLRVVDDVLDPASGIATAARFLVDARRPGAEPG